MRLGRQTFRPRYIPSELGWERSGCARSPNFLPGAQSSHGSRRIWHVAYPNGGWVRSHASPPDIRSEPTMPYLRGCSCAEGWTGPAKIGRGASLRSSYADLWWWHPWPVLPTSNGKERCPANVRSGLVRPLQFYVPWPARTFPSEDVQREQAKARRACTCASFPQTHACRPAGAFLYGAPIRCVPGRISTMPSTCMRQMVSPYPRQSSTAASNTAPILATAR